MTMWDISLANLILIQGVASLLTFNGRCCLKYSFNGSALRSFYVPKRILRIFYLDLISLIFTVFKLWCPAHLFPNTPRTLHYATFCRSTVNRTKTHFWSHKEEEKRTLVGDNCIIYQWKTYGQNLSSTSGQDILFLWISFKISS